MVFFVYSHENAKWSNSVIRKRKNRNPFIVLIYKLFSMLSKWLQTSEGFGEYYWAIHNLCITWLLLFYFLKSLYFIILHTFIEISWDLILGLLICDQQSYFCLRMVLISFTHVYFNIPFGFVAFHIVQIKDANKYLLWILSC